MKALDRGQTPTITPDLTDELFIVQVDADGVARDGRASIGTLLEATASSQFTPGVSRTVLPRKQAQTVVTSFATSHGWANAFPGTSAADTTDYLVGTQSLKLTGANATTGVYKAGYSIDMTGRAWGILMRVEDFTKLDQINFYASNTGETAYDVWTWARNDQYFKAGEWVWISLPYGSNSTVGSTPRANVQRLTVRAVPLSGQTINVWLQQIVHFPVQTTYSTGVASISFDDGRSTVMTAAKKMAAYGWRGQVYIIPEAVSTANYLTLAELKTLKNTYGWGIGLDGASSYLAMTAADLETYIRTNKQYLYDNGLVTSGVDHISYPGVGNVNDAVIAVTSKYAATAHTGVIVPVPSETIPPLDPNRLRSVTGITSHSGGISLATAQGYIDAAVANDGWLNLIFHGVVTPTTATTEITPTDFDTMLAYLASSTISVVPIGDVMRA